jgi:3'(2'), 5'-bisphosphate nucleotidase
MSLDLTIGQHITCEAIVDIAQKAADVILKIYDSKDEDWNVEMKADDSPLTRADKEANAVICEGLAKIAPHVPIVSEENKQLPFEVRKNYKYSWCVDPLDGTKEFIKRNGQFTVNIALIEGDTPILGVVQVPATGKVYHAAKGQGAFVRNGPGAPSERINVKSFSMNDEGLTLVGSASHSSAATTEFVSQFANPKFQQLGSSLKLLMIAEGAAHIYPRLAPTCEWDTCAAHAIVLEAGGQVMQAGLCDNKGNALEDWKEVLKQEKPLVYNKENVLNPYFVVYGKRA